MKNSKANIILIVLIILVYCGDIYLYFFYQKPTNNIQLEEPKEKKVKEDIYITQDFFKDNEPRILGIGYYQEPIGSLIFYKSSYNENLIRVIIGEQDELTDLTYKSILSLIEFMHPEEYDEFVANFKELKNLGFKDFCK